MLRGTFSQVDFGRHFGFSGQTTHASGREPLPYSGDMFFRSSVARKSVAKYDLVDGELKPAQATTHHLFVTCRVPVQRAQCEVELIGMNGAKTTTFQCAKFKPVLSP
jgi:hypothetical protein